MWSLTASMLLLDRSGLTPIHNKDLHSFSDGLLLCKAHFRPYLLTSDIWHTVESSDISHNCHPTEKVTENRKKC